MLGVSANTDAIGPKRVLRLYDRQNNGMQCHALSLDCSRVAVIASLCTARVSLPCGLFVQFGWPRIYRSTSICDSSSPHRAGFGARAGYLGFVVDGTAWGLFVHE